MAAIYDPYFQYGTSDEGDDLCEICYKTAGTHVSQYAFSQSLQQNLCKTCFEAHQPGAAVITQKKERKNYRPLVTWKSCQNHEGLIQDVLCCNHLDLICASCHNEHHNSCKVKPLADEPSFEISEIRFLEDKTMKIRSEAFESMTHKMVGIQFIRKSVLDAIRKSCGEMLSMVKECEESTKQRTNDACNEMGKTTGKHMSKLEENLSKFENVLIENGGGYSNTRDKTNFDALPELIPLIKEHSNKLFESVKKDTIMHFVTMFEKLVCNSLSQYCQTENLSKSQNNSHNHKYIVTLPSVSHVPYGYELQNETKQKRQLDDKVDGQKKFDIHRIQASRLESFTVKLDDEKDDCCITGLCLTDEGAFLIVDCYNKKVKYFSAEGKELSSLLMPGEPFDVSISGKSEAMVSMWENQKRIHIIGFKDDQLVMNNTITLRNRVHGIAAVENDFAVSCDDKNPSVKLVDREGEIKWSQSFNSEGRKIFKAPGYILTQFIKGVPHIIVSDKDAHTLTVMEAKTGVLVKSCCLSKTGPYGLTSWNGNVVVGYCYSAGVCVWSSDLSDHIVLLSSKDSIKRPYAIVFNPLTNELLLSSWRCNTLERFKIS